jgi:hypothetical protein
MKAPSAGFFWAKLYSRISETEFASSNVSHRLGRPDRDKAVGITMQNALILIDIE